MDSKIISLCRSLKARVAMGLLLASVLAQPVAGESELLTKVRAGGNVKVVLLGTSLTAAATWPGSLQSWLSAESPGPGTVTVVNRAVSGKASNHGLATQTPVALRDNPDAVFIEFSMNDAASSLNITKQQAEDNLNAMIDAFVAHNPDVIIVLQTMNNLPASTSPFSPRVDLNGYYQIYRDVAAERSAILIDHYPNWLELFTNDLPTWNSYMNDAVHPNALGQNSVLMPELQAVLEQPSGPPAPPGMLVAWDDWLNLTGSDTAPDDIGVTGFTGNTVSSRNLPGDFGSTDGTYGSALPGANPANVNALLPNSANPSTTITLTNNTGQAYSITSLHLDLVQRFNAARQFAVTYLGGGLGPASTQILQESHPTIPDSSTFVPHSYDLDLTTLLADTVLLNGETASFSIVVSDSPGANSTFIDNLAFQGSMVDVSSNQGPVWRSDPVLENGATETSSYTGSLADNASDPNGDSLIFTKVSGPAWLVVAIDGSLSGTPTSNDAGSNVFGVTVSDGVAPAVSATLVIDVTNVDIPPAFAADPLVAVTAFENVAYAATITGSAIDVDGDLITYVKTDGPSWLVASGDGTLSGTPAGADVGINSFTVSATSGSTPPIQATLEITVNPAPPTAPGKTLVLWDYWADNTTPYLPDAAASGWIGSVSTTQDRFNASFGSTDGSFGSLPGADTDLGAILLRQNGGNLSVAITVTNGSGQAHSIDSIHFDFGVRILSPDSFTLSYTEGGLGPAATLIGSATQLPETVGATQEAGEGDTYYPFDFTLADFLADTILESGESATFTLVLSGVGTQQNYSISGSSIVDNIAIQGTPVVETAAPRLIEFTRDAQTGICQVTVQGLPDTRYKLVRADDLDFASPDLDPVALTGVVVGALDGNDVITSPSGIATVQFNLGLGATGFIRGEEAP